MLLLPIFQTTRRCPTIRRDPVVCAKDAVILHPKRVNVLISSAA
jgi:hypothetical protein